MWLFTRWRTGWESSSSSEASVQYEFLNLDRSFQSGETTQFTLLHGFFFPPDLSRLDLWTLMQNTLWSQEAIKRRMYNLAAFCRSSTASSLLPSVYNHRADRGTALRTQKSDINTQDCLSPFSLSRSDKTELSPKVSNGYAWKLIRNASFSIYDLFNSRSSTDPISLLFYQVNTSIDQLKWSKVRHLLLSLIHLPKWEKQQREIYLKLMIFLLLLLNPNSFHQVSVGAVLNNHLIVWKHINTQVSVLVLL